MVLSSDLSPFRRLIVLIHVIIGVHSFLPSRQFAAVNYRKQLGESPLHPTKVPSSCLLFLKKQDTVLVIGGTGGVGQLTTQKLLQRGIRVRITSRNVESAKGIIQDERVDIVPLNLVADNNEKDIQQALQNVKGLVISVGTTAFPTKKWANGNTPVAIDEVAVKKIIQQAAAASSSVEKVVLVTSVGVERTKQMPFLILNLFGVLDAKRSGEEALKEAGKHGSFYYAIVRPGRLVGGPFTNEDIAKLLQIEGGTENGVDVERGDTLLGDCKRDACAEAIVQCLINDECQNVDFSIVSNEQQALSDEEWTSVFNKL